MMGLAIHFNHGPERIGLPFQAAAAEPGHAINFSHGKSQFVYTPLRSGAPDRQDITEARLRIAETAIG
jgi:hypothetical protein